MMMILFQNYKCIDKSTALQDVVVPTLLYKLATIVEGNQKAPFSIATTPKYRGGHYSFPWNAPLYPWYVPYIAEC